MYMCTCIGIDHVHDRQTRLHDSIVNEMDY